MTRRNAPQTRITPDLLLRAYSIGIFPMAENADDPSIHWIEPKWRGVIPLNGFKLSHSLAKLLRSDHFSIRIDTDFDGVIEACATVHGSTWINERIRALYRALFDEGHVHTVEVWQGDQLVGGLYGVSLGAAFFGESMFHRERDASKIALAHLVARLLTGNYQLLDTQFLTPHLASLGGIEIARRAYQTQLTNAVTRDADFAAWDRDGVRTGSDVIDTIRKAAAAPIDPA